MNASLKKKTLRFAPHHFVKTGMAWPHLFWWPNFVPVWQWARKQKISRWPFSLFLVQFAIWRVENIRQDLKFLIRPLKRKFDLKQRKSKAGDYFDSITLVQLRNGTDRTGFSPDPINLGARTSWFRCVPAWKQGFAFCLDIRTPSYIVRYGATRSRLAVFLSRLKIGSRDLNKQFEKT